MINTKTMSTKRARQFSKIIVSTCILSVNNYRKSKAAAKRKGKNGFHCLFPDYQDWDMNLLVKPKKYYKPIV